MVGPFKTAPRGLTHLLVAVDKFTKWIEAKPIKKLDSSSTIKFFNEIIVRYGVPRNIITDNGTNFTKGVFAEFCSQKGIRLDLASVAHPHSIGQVEKANGLILAGIKARLVEPLERSAGCWVEELPSVLWSLRTTPTRSIGFTPFFLVYEAEVVLPTDIEFDVPRVVQYTQEQAKEAREDGVDLLEEAREQALARSVLYQ
jgi:transposase InsO family protein